MYQGWVDAGYFTADPTSDKPPYSIVLPPPNVTGSLHMGHALDHTLMDALTRRKRMQGYEVLWLPGMDHAGIATQTLVEKQLAAGGKTKEDFGREGFVEKVWEWKRESGGTIGGQMRRLGDGVDWSRDRFTMDEGLSRAVRTIFKRLFDAGLIYRAERLVNWSPVLETAISDLEVLQVEKTGTFKWQRGGEEELDAGKLEKALAKDPNGHLYYFDYPIQGAAYDPENPETYITVATTRPETMLGDTGVAVHPDDEPAPPKYRSVSGEHRMQGYITVCEPPHLLGLTWGEEQGVPSEVRFELSPQGSQVKLTVTHSRLSSRDDMLSVSGGWHTHLAILRARLEGTAPPGFWRTHTRLEAAYEERLPRAA